MVYGFERTSSQYQPVGSGAYSLPVVFETLLIGVLRYSELNRLDAAYNLTMSYVSLRTFNCNGDEAMSLLRSIRNRWDLACVLVATTGWLSAGYSPPSWESGAHDRGVVALERGDTTTALRELQ